VPRQNKFPHYTDTMKMANTISSSNSIKNFSCHNKASSYMAYTFHHHITPPAEKTCFIHWKKRHALSRLREMCLFVGI